MKKLSVIVLATIVAITTLVINGETEANAARRAAMFDWNLTTHDFGKIDKDIPAMATFDFTNTGNEPLVIVSAKGSCGCTVADYSKREIAPGEKGKVTATYNAKKVGLFNKTVTVQANTGTESIVLKIKGEVVE